MKNSSLLLTVVCIIITNSIYSQNTYYVNGNSSTANNNNTGLSPDSAWKTIKRACNTAVAKDTVIVMPAVYRETIKPSNSGIVNEYITFRSEPLFGAKIVGIVPLDSILMEGAIWQQDTLWHQLDANLNNVWKIQLDTTKHGYVEAYRDTMRMPSFKSLNGNGFQLPLDGSYIYQTQVSPGKSFVSDSLNTLFVFLEDTVSSPGIYSWYISKNNGAWLENKSFINIQGFEIDSFAEVGILVEGCNHIIIDTNRIYKNGRTGVAVNWTNSKIWITNNDVADNGIGLGYSSGISIYRATDSSLYIIGNISHHNADSSLFHSDGNGFIIDESADAGLNGGCIFKNNISYSNKGSGIRVHRSKNCKVINNTTYFNVSNEMDVGDQIAPSASADTSIILDNIIIENNIFYAKPNKYPLNISFTHNSGSVFSNFNDFYRDSANTSTLLFCIIDSLNLMYSGTDSLSQFQNLTGNDISSFVANPLLDSTNLHLLSTSPCIDTGNPDLNNNGQTWVTDTSDRDPDSTQLDIGAYYYEHSSVIENNISQNNSVKIYPNPFSETTTLQITNEEVHNYELKIYDLFGREVRKYQIRNQKTEILSENLPNGIYFLQIKSNNYLQTIKLEVIK